MLGEDRGLGVHQHHLPLGLVGVLEPELDQLRLVAHEQRRLAHAQRQVVLEWACRRLLLQTLAQEQRHYGWQHAVDVFLALHDLLVVGEVAGQRQVHGGTVAGAHVGGVDQHCLAGGKGLAALQVAPARTLFDQRHQRRQVDHVVDIALPFRNLVGDQDLGDGPPAGQHHGRVEGVEDVRRFGLRAQLRRRRRPRGEAEVILASVVAAGDGARAGLLHRHRNALLGESKHHARVGEEGFLLAADEAAHADLASGLDLRRGLRRALLADAAVGVPDAATHRQQQQRCQSRSHEPAHFHVRILSFRRSESSG